MPWIDDIISSGNSTHEVFSADENLSVMTHEQAARMFGVDLEKSPNLTYLPFTLCSSFPNFNKKGRGFSPTVLSASFASLNGQVVDMEHMMASNSATIKEDWILGYVKGMKFATPKKLPGLVKEKGTHELAKFKSPLPVTGLSALFNRAQGVSNIVDDYIGGKNLWKVSMECNHSWADAVFYYDGVFIPVKDAEKPMRDCISMAGIKDYKGKPLKALLGELAGKIDFWGVALTQMPADTTADVFSLVAAPSRDAASFMPVKKFDFREVASTKKFFSGDHDISEEDIENVSDRLITESANIKVIGYTDPAIDGHTHEILSDLTVVPAMGHSHYLKAQNLSTGNDATFSAVTDTYNRYSDYPTTRPETHLHLVTIPLQGEVNPDSGSVTTEEEMPKTIAEMRKQLAEVASLLKKGADAETASANTKLTELLNDMASIQSEESMKKFFDDTLAAKIASGEICTKEQATTELASAIKKREDELKAEFAAEKLKVEQTAERERMILASGLDIASVLPNVKNGDKPVTIKDRFDAIPLENKAGLETEIATMKLIFPETKGGKGTKETPKPAHVPGGGPNGETASTQQQQTQKPRPSHLVGKSGFSS